jgi:integrase
MAVLTPRHIDLAAGVVCLGAKETKNGKGARQPLHPAAQAELRDWLKDKPADRPLWPGTWTDRAPKMIKKDLADVGIPYAVRDHDGVVRYADFHALRHTYVSLLASTGVNVKVAQVLARHGDPRLTMAVYAHATQDEQVQAVAGLPLPGSPPIWTVEQMAIGLWLLHTLVSGFFQATRQATPAGDEPQRKAG